MSRLTTHLRTNIGGYVGVFLALSSGAYAAGLAPDSVKSKHIKDEEIQSADLGENSVMGPEVVNGSLTGADLASSSINGQQIAESTLGEVPNATIAGHGGYGRQSGGGEFGSSCNPSDDLYTTCASVALTPSAPARFLLTGRFEVRNGDHDDVGTALCRLGSSSAGGIPGTSVNVNVTWERNAWEHVTLTGVTDVYQPGSYSFGIDCSETYGDVTIQNARVTAVAISPF